MNNFDVAVGPCETKFQSSRMLRRKGFHVLFQILSDTNQTARPGRQVGAGKEVEEHQWLQHRWKGLFKIWRDREAREG